MLLDIVSGEECTRRTKLQKIVISERLKKKSKTVSSGIFTIRNNNSIKSATTFSCR